MPPTEVLPYYLALYSFVTMWSQDHLLEGETVVAGGHRSRSYPPCIIAVRWYTGIGLAVYHVVVMALSNKGSLMTRLAPDLLTSTSPPCGLVVWAHTEVGIYGATCRPIAHLQR